jgi:hypothetical protein
MKNGLKLLRWTLAISIMMAFFYSTIATAKNRKSPDNIIQSLASIEHVQTQMEKLTPILLSPDISFLSQSEKSALYDIIRAARLMDSAFLMQVHPKNILLQHALKKYRNTPEQVYYDFFKIMYGPWDRLDENEPFINLDQFKPPGANYYPFDMTAEEFTAWIEANPDQEEDFTSPFTMIRRNKTNLRAIPYSCHFRKILRRAAMLLRRAAAKTKDETLSTYLRSRAQSFLSNDYRQSDIDWIGLNGDIELVIGPYETYEDELLGYKAAFEAFVCLVDREESEKLEIIEDFRAEMVENYPLPPEFEMTPKGLASPIKVVNEVFSAGDARVGIPAIAFNLPNDEWVRENVGSKNVMLKNMLEAKYNGVLVPIKDRILAEADRDKPTFDGFFNYVLMHEISHGLGPGNIVVDGRETTVREELKELYSTIEECQADVLSIFNTQYLIDAPNSPMPEGLEEALYASYLAGMFRSIRFGTDSAHGGAITIELNYHLENYGFNVDENGLFYLDVDALKSSVQSLANQLLIIELTGDYDGAVELINTYRFVSPEVQTALDSIADVPIDVIKQYPFD